MKHPRVSIPDTYPIANHETNASIDVSKV